jgi:glycerophosphoryl diester phosphodiesterase
MPAWPFLSDTPPLAIAHRGGIGRHGENTMEAFAEAVALGYRYVETDVHLSRDGEVVAFHDPDLRRLTGRDGRIADLDWPAIARLSVSGGGRIPRLADLLTAWPDLFVNIDPKSDAVVAPLIRLLRELGAIERVCVGSFSGARLRAMREAFGPALATSMGPLEVLRLRAASLGLGAAPRGPVGAQVPMRQFGLPVVDARLVRHAHEEGLKVHVWTVNDRETMTRLLDLGVDAIMTDDLPLLREVFEQRGLWPGG